MLYNHLGFSNMTYADQAQPAADPAPAIALTAVAPGVLSVDTAGQPDAAGSVEGATGKKAASLWWLLIAAGVIVWNM